VPEGADRHMTLAVDLGRVMQGCGMLPDHDLYPGRVEVPQDAADRR
jgi:hypothetical protein